MNENEQLQPPPQEPQPTTPTAPEPLIGKESAPAPKPEAPAQLTEADIKLPEGFTADKELMSKYLGVMNNQELSAAERGQQLIDLYADVTKAASERISAAFLEMQQQWQDEVLNDKEIGGEKLEPILGKVEKLLVAYGSPELRQVFAGTGAGNSIHMVRFLAKIADQLSEGTPLPGAVTNPQVSLAEKLYPTMSKGN